MTTPIAMTSTPPPTIAPGWHLSRVAETDSTQADLVIAAPGAPDRTVLVADLQHRGRGRLDRRWDAPAGTSLMFSVLLRPRSVPTGQQGWIGALLGLAAVRGIQRITGLKAALKWPNDVLIGGRKVAGILAELTGDGVVVGIGVNVTMSAEDLPRPDATSLLLAGADAARLDRDVLLASFLAEFDGLLRRWEDAAGDMVAAGLRADYLAASATIGLSVRVELPHHDVVHGVAVDVTATGMLVVESDGHRRAFAAGDVTHLRAP